MAINSLQLNNGTPFVGLGTQTFNVISAGLYTLQFFITIPYVAIGSQDNSAQAATDSNASALSVVVNQNGSPIYTLTGPSPTQPSVGGNVSFQAAVSDVITLVLSSANASDAGFNAVKGVANLFQGPL